jgi:hypothetical protein
VEWLALVAVVVVTVYLALIVGLVHGARQWDVRMIARLVPHCAVVFKRLLGD